MLSATQTFATRVVRVWGAVLRGLDPKSSTFETPPRPNRSASTVSANLPHSAPVAPPLGSEQRIVEALLSFQALALNHLQASCTVVAQAGAFQTVESPVS
jgi:hypothetical protein